MIKNKSEEYYYNSGYYHGILASLEIIRTEERKKDGADWIKIGRIIKALSREFEISKDWMEISKEVYENNDS